jgi:hypothetical protein
MRIGLQARIGIDTIVSGEAVDKKLGESPQIGRETVVSEFSGIQRKEGRMEKDTQIGIKTIVN